MNVIPYSNLALAFIPVAITVFIMISWSLDINRTIYALARMLIQLLLIGFVLDSIFTSNNHWISLSVLTVMLLIASWITLKALPNTINNLFLTILISLGLGSVFTLIIVSKGVLIITPWFDPKVLIPIGGMIFANSMNTMSLAGERFFSELKNNTIIESRNTAFQAAMIPIINSLFAVGLVSLPGMMTGQILSGIEPLVAVRYQIMVMCMILGSGGISTALFLYLIIKGLDSKNS